MGLYPLDSKDVEAVGRSRANRDMPQSIKYLTYGGFIICFLGLMYSWSFGGGLKGLGIGVIGVAMVWYSSHLGDKKRVRIIRELKQEWRDNRDIETRDRARQEVEK